MERTFVDEARIHVAAGDGGHGVASFHREKRKPKGRPDGGSGGDGGSVVLQVAPGVATLAELADHPHLKAGRGRNGQGNDKHGAAAADRIVPVPDGTVVLDESGTTVADLVGEGAKVVVARGGRGGRGNAALATARRRAPAFAERGEPGEQRWLQLELKILADVGLVGFPNAGKSSLIARLSAARPTIADYPFTTLTPNLGVAETADSRFVVADVPGLIEGASEGRGLGLAFLRHLDRCQVMCFVLDTTAAIAPGEAAAALRRELQAHDPALVARHAVVVANKIDVDGVGAAVEDACAAAQAAGAAFVAVSALRGDGVEELRDILATAVARARSDAPPVSHRLVRIRPAEDGVTVDRDAAGTWIVRSEGAEAVVLRFDVDQPEALRYVQDRLARLGVEDALTAAGAREGDEVRIGDVTFDFSPDHAAGEG